MDDLVAQIGELDHELDKLTHKRRIAADMISGLLQNGFDKDLEIANLNQRIERLRARIRDLQPRADTIPRLENTTRLLTTKVNIQEGEIRALQWMIKTLTERQK